ncbi:hypothetical protein MUK42_35541 [Musa troglodytarum]|uniref:Uncharacterized protein n=1 Tax=Musa troglodytarum TaxID=320322 RepID=A0A9E7EE53_9LILI|nr:hypothetical protein MUK42_35541 [Musa troglodytarum]
MALNEANPFLLHRPKSYDVGGHPLPIRHRKIRCRRRIPVSTLTAASPSSAVSQSESLPAADSFLLLSVGFAAVDGFLPQPSPVSYPRLPSSCRRVSRHRSLLPCVVSALFPLAAATKTPIYGAISTYQEELKEMENQSREEYIGS